MKGFQKFILTRKAWQLFIVLGIPLALGNYSSRFEIQKWITFECIDVLLVVGWYNIIASNLLLKILLPHQFNLQRLRVASLMVVISMIVLSLIIALGLGDQSNQKVITIVGLFYCIDVVGRILTSVLKGSIADFNESLSNMFLLAALPLGIWIIQPKIREIFSHQ